LRVILPVKLTRKLFGKLKRDSCVYFRKIVWVFKAVQFNYAFGCLQSLKCRGHLGWSRSGYSPHQRSMGQ
jgi:hypothetical protein